MKSGIWEKLKRAPKLEWSDIALLIIPGLVWALAVHSRPTLIHPRCPIAPQDCLKEDIFYPDKLALGLDSKKADNYSFLTQDISGYFAAGVPMAWSLTLMALKRIHPVTGLIFIGTDAVIFGQAALWNGLATETARIMTQRPRPFVYKDVSYYGHPTAHYTSFYSGHTSFSAAAGTTMVATLLGRGAPLALVFSAGSVSLVLVFLTALLRVLAGRHFPTDVLAGAFAGALVALLVALLHRRHKLKA